MAPETVAQSANRLFLFKSIEFLDLRQAAEVGVAGSCLLESGSEPPMVARLRVPRDPRALEFISMAGLIYKWMDPLHVLVIDSSSRISLVSKEADVQWLSFQQWRSEAFEVCSNPSDDKDTSVDSCGCQSSDSNSRTLVSTSASTGHAQPSSYTKAQAWLDADIGPRYCGVIKAFDASRGFGFIRCLETYRRFKLDVFLHSSQIARPCIGQHVSFVVSVNARGQPQAKELRAVPTDVGLWPNVEVGSFDGDADGRTTTGPSSDCASTSDLDSCAGQEASHPLSPLAWLGGSAHDVNSQ